MLDDDVRIPPPGYRSAPQRRAEEMRRMVYMGGGAAVVVLLAVIGYFVATGSGSEGVPVIQAPATPVKEKPADPGGLSVTNQGSGLLTSGSSSAVAPAPEAPDPAALAAAAKQEQPAPPAAKPAPPVNPAPAAAPATTAPPATTMTQAPAVSIPSVPETPAAPGQKQTAMNVPPPSREASRTHDLAQEYRPSAQASHGAVRVQLAALDSHDAALHEWDHLSRRMPDLFAGHRPIISQAQVNGHTWWRLRTAGFSSVAEATTFCRDVRVQGGACTVASF